MNPFKQQSEQLCNHYMDWKKINSKPYDKETADPYTKVRVILMNGTEFEANWFLHQLARHTDDNDLRREVALVRAQEQQQQKRIASLKPLDENMLETTIAYEQLAIDLTAILSQMETDENNIKALNFALLEDFDHLYRFANLLKVDYGVDAARLVGKFTEIMPGRPTIAEHRFPSDNVKYPMDSKKAQLFSALVGGIITAAEQQTMNFYMNLANFYPNERGRKLFTEIAMVEEEHVTQYESLKDPRLSWLECWVMHEYTECYLYYSMMNDETDKYIRKIYEEHYAMELSHLKVAADALKKYENKNYSVVIPQPEFPALLKFGGNKQFIRNVIANTIGLTADKEEYIFADKLDKNSCFALYQEWVNARTKDVPSHDVIRFSISELNGDYRYQDAPHPIPELGDRMHDNTTIARP